MSTFAQLQEDLQEASAAVARAERIVALHPNYPSAVATLKTILKRQENLREQFLEEASALGMNACSYKVELERGRQATISSLAATLDSFQRVFTSVYDSIINGPKKIAKVGAEIVAVTSLGFAYAFPGSIGVMMTLINEKTLIDSHIDEAMGLTFELLKANDVVQIEALTEQVGIAAVKMVHWWAHENAKAGFGADIHWIRQGAPELEVRVQPEEIANLAHQIAQATAREVIVELGTLTSVNMEKKSFEMKLDYNTIRGTFDKAITEMQPAMLPKRYKATLSAQTKIASADRPNEEMETTFLLLKLEEPNFTYLQMLES